MAELTETAERVKQTAEGLFMQYGLRSVSMDDIAAALGISKKTIYKFYADKDALVEDVIDSLIAKNRESCRYDQQQADNAIHEIFLAIELMMEIFRTMNPALVFDMQKYYPAAFRKFAEHKNKYMLGVIKANMLRGIEEGLYREDIDIEILSRFRVESMMIPFNPEFHSKLKTTLMEIEKEILLHFLFGMVSPKGYKMAVKYYTKSNK